MHDARINEFSAVRRAGLVLLVASLVFAWGISGAQTNAANELYTAAAVRSLTVEQAQAKVRVKLRGVVTFFDSNLYSRFIQDETAGIYLYDSGLPVYFAPGEIVEVEGTSSAGEYAPIVVPERITAVGKSALPVPRPVTYERLASGQEDSQFVEIAGIVRSVQFHEPSTHYQIEIATGGGRLSVFARELPVKRPQELLDSTVRVRGVCSTQFNHQRQLFAIRLMVPRPEDLVIEEAAPADPYAIPSRPIGSLLQFAPQEAFGHRVKVAGTVIYFRPGRELFLQDGNQGIQVQTTSEEPLQLGDYVEALGFVGQGEYTPALQDAIYRKLRSGPPLKPATLSINEALKGMHDCQLIRVSARLLDRGLHGAERRLILQDDDFTFNVHLQSTDGQDVFGQLQNGSRLSVVGVCRIDPGEWEAGEDWRARALRIELRSPSDIVLLAAPPWWTLRKVLWMAGALGLVSLAAIGWVAVLHRQVAERTRELEAEIQERQRAERRREVEQERTRVAQDLHDELGATLTEVSMLGSLARTPSLTPETKERYLEQLTRVSRALVATLDEIVWAVNPKYDSVGALVSYYSLFAQRFLNLAGMACRLQVSESFPDAPLDSRLRHGIFLAFKEALNNAVRHSGASEVRITMDGADRRLRIMVSDNGKGFETIATAPGSDGVASMQQRMYKLGGHCQISSQPGTGTTVELSLPIGDQIA
jgi:signal transduction histidine kinase